MEIHLWNIRDWAKGTSIRTMADIIAFNAANAGTFEKTVFVKVKGYDAPLELKIAGEVVPAAK